MHQIEYATASDLWCITCYFNPCRYGRRFRNYAEFRKPFDAAGLRLLTIECRFEGGAPDLASYDGVIVLEGSKRP